MRALVLGPSHAKSGMCSACDRWIDRKEGGRTALLAAVVVVADNGAATDVRLCRRCIRAAFHAASGEVGEVRR